MSEKTTYQMPPEPFGPVIDGEGRRWHRNVESIWQCNDKDFLPQSWHRLVVDRGPLTDAPEPAWPTAPHVWWDGRVWERYDKGGYQVAGDDWHESHMTSMDDAMREEARWFAYEAVPVTIVPAAEWVILRRCVEDEGVVWDAAEALVDATERLGQADE